VLLGTAQGNQLDARPAEARPDLRLSDGGGAGYDSAASLASRSPRVGAYLNSVAVPQTDLRVTVEVVDSSRFGAGTELRWRRDRGRWWSGILFRLEDAHAHQLATVTYGFSGQPKRIAIGDLAYRAHSDGLRMSVRVTDEHSGAEAASLKVASSDGLITIPDGPTLRCTQVGARPGRTLQVTDGESTAMTITWEPMTWWGFAEGSATLGDAALGDSTVLVACLAFQYFIPKTGGA
jgi:hypothetical protein